MATSTITTVDRIGSYTGHHIVRTSGGVLYVLCIDTGSPWKLAMAKSSNGTSWTVDLDGTNAPATDTTATSYVNAMAIDGSDVIHVVYLYDQTAMSPEFRVVTFTTSNDTWGTPSTLKTGIVVNSSTDSSTIAVDSNGKVHITFNSNDSSMGQNYSTTWYTNNVGGSYKTAVELRGASSQTHFTPGDMLINGSNIPEIAGYVASVNGVSALQGNANDTTSATIATASTTYQGSTTMKHKMAIDSSGNTYITSFDYNNGKLTLIKHTSGTWTSGWSESNTPTSGSYVSGNHGGVPCIVGTTVYHIFPGSGGGDYSGLYYSQWNGSSWDSHNNTIVADSVTVPIANVVWAKNYMNHDTTAIHAIKGYPAGNGVYYYKLSLSGISNISGTAAVVVSQGTSVLKGNTPNNTGTAAVVAAGTSTLSDLRLITGTAAVVSANTGTGVLVSPITGTATVVVAEGTSVLKGNTPNNTGTAAVVVAEGTSVLKGNTPNNTGTAAAVFAEATSVLKGLFPATGTSAALFAEGTSVLKGNTPNNTGTAAAVFDVATSTLIGLFPATGTSAAVFAEATSVLIGIFPATGTAAAIFDGTGTLESGFSPIDGTAVVVVAEGTSTLTGTGIIDGTSAVVADSGTSVLTGTGIIDGTAAVVSDNTGTGILIGVLAGTGAVVSDGTGTMRGDGFMDGTSPVIVAESTSTMRGDGFMDGTSAVVSDNTGTAAGTIFADGTAAAVFGEATSSMILLGPMTGTAAVVVGAGTSVLKGNTPNNTGTAAVVVGAGTSVLLGANPKYMFMTGWETNAMSGSWFEGSATAGTAAAATDRVRTGTYALKLTPSGTAPYYTYQATRWETTNGDGRLVEFFVQFDDATPLTTHTFFRTSDDTTGTNASISLQITTTGQLRVLNSTGATVATTAGAVFSDDTWHRISLTWQELDTGTYRVDVDRVQQLSGSSDFLLAGGATIYRQLLGSTNASDLATWFDDLFEMSGVSASYFIPGDYKVFVFRPDPAAGATDIGSTLNSGTWGDTNDGAEDTAATEAVYTGTPLAGSVTFDGTGGGPNGTTMNVVYAAEWLASLKRGTGGSTTHTLLIGNSVDGTTGLVVSPSNSAYALFGAVRKDMTIVPEKTEYFRIGMDVSGNQDMYMGEAWAYLLASLGGLEPITGTAAAVFAEATTVLKGNGLMTGTSAGIFGEAISTLTSAASAIDGTIAVLFDGTGTLIGLAPVTGTAIALFDPAVSVLRADGFLDGTSAALFDSGTSTLRADAFADGTSAVLSDGTGALTGLAPIDGTSAVIADSPGTLIGIAQITGTAAVVSAEAVSTLSGVSPIDGSADVVSDNTGTMRADAFMDATAVVVFGGTSTIRADVFLGDSTAPVVFGGTSLLTGLSPATGTAVATFGNTGTAIGASLITGTSAVVSGNTGTVSAKGFLTGTAPVVVDATATTSAIAHRTGTAAVTFGGTGTWRATAQIGGTCVAVFGVGTTTLTKVERVATVVKARKRFLVSRIEKNQTIVKARKRFLIGKG